MTSSSSSSTTAAMVVGHAPTTRFKYDPPIWATKSTFENVPTAGRLHLANLPTPLYKLVPHNSRFGSADDSILQQLAKLDITLYVKRDDMTGGCETGGNKIRKLEFLLADALDKGYTRVVTIGGEQSNHCRATAGACRMVGLEPHLILRTKRADDATSSTTDNFGYTGNILFDRMVGSTIYACTPGEYGRLGSTELVSRLCAHLERTGSSGDDNAGKVYPIPVGGSNGVGTWGYINAVDEVLSQWQLMESKPSLDHVVFASGSGGTAAGIALGMALAHGSGGGGTSSTPPPQVHAIGVCDDPDYFYHYIAGIADQMGIQVPDGTSSTESFIRQRMIAHQGKGNGYAVSTKDELDFITKLSLETGIVLDPVYSGKAFYHFITSVLGEDSEKYRGKNILFWHTGGALGLFDKGDDLLPTLATIAPVKRLDIYGKGLENGIDISQKIE